MSLAMSNFMNETEILKKKTSFEKIKLPRLHRILIKKKKKKETCGIFSYM